MATQPTGYLDFNWNPTPNVDGYKVKLYKNNSYYKTNTVSSHNIRVSGLIENDLIHGFAYPYKSDLIYPSFENLTPQTVPVSRFDHTFDLNKLTINNRPITLSFLNNDNSTLYSEFIYKSQSNNIDLSIISPRSEEILYNFDEEPFLESIYYNIYSSEENSSLLESHEVDSFSFDILNTGQYGRNFMAQIAINDFYGSGITGNINFINEPIHINSISINHSRSENEATLNILSSYTKECKKVDYLTYDNNDCTGNYLLSGTSESVSNYDIHLGLDFSGSLKIIPHDLYGSGYHYVNKDVHFADLSIAETFNKINNHYIDGGSSYSIYEIHAEKTNASESGSYFEISIDPEINSNFDENSYFTGRFDDISSGYSFDFFPFIDPLGDSVQYFYASLNLYQSGTSILEDNVLTSGSLLAPRFSSSGVKFDYFNGLSTLSFETNPKLSYSGINLMVSGKNDLTYNDYSEINYEVSDLYPHLSLRIVDAVNANIIYDEIEITGSGKLPSVSVSGADFATADGMKGILISNDNADVSINQVRSYGRFSFLETSTGVDTLSQEYNDILQFNDYSSFEEDIKYVGNNLSVGPPGLTRNLNYTIPGSTASFESGLHYMHRFIPENGYGTGSVTEVFYIEYPLNSFAQYMDGNQQSTDQSISTIQNDFATLSYVNSRISEFSNSLKYEGVLSNSTAQGIILNTGQTINYDMVSGNKIVINNNNGSDHINLNVTNLNRSAVQVFDFDLYSYNLNYTEYTGININLTAENQSVNIVNSGNFSRSDYNVVNIKLMNLNAGWQSIQTYY